MTRLTLRRRNEKMAAMRLQGKTIQEIALVFGLDKSTVSSAMKRMGVQAPKDEAHYRCGHDRTAGNTIQNGIPRCKTCHRRWAREFMRRKTAGRSLLERAWPTVRLG